MRNFVDVPWRKVIDANLKYETLTTWCEDILGPTGCPYFCTDLNREEWLYGTWYIAGSSQVYCFKNGEDALAFRLKFGL